MGDSYDWIGLTPASYRDAAIQFLQIESAAATERDAIVIAIESGQIVAAMRGRRLSGGLGAVWPAMADSGPASFELLGRLFELLEQSLRTEQTGLLQAVVDSRQGDESTQFQTLGFSFVADLLFLLLNSSSQSNQEDDLEFEPYDTSARDRLVEVVAGTLENTLDCVWLNGLRSAEQIVAGYVEDAAGQFPGWYLVRSGGHDIGCLLLTDRSDDDLAEIGYMGLAPAARGRGFGTRLVQRAQRVAGEWGRSNLLAIVDETNLPARKCYETCGSIQWDRRILMAKVY